ncbi:MAG: 30S ribosomal protein S4 [bacterium]|nr:30S ribosomal protein S4 [bacterium]
MAKNFTSVTKLSRREAVALHPKAVKSLTKRNYPPGDHGLSRRPRPGNYTMQLREKQKIKRIYGILEKQFRRYVAKSEQMRGVSGENLLILLERRLDNVCYRLNLATSRQAARQLVSHAHIRLNGKKVNIPSILVDIGDEITIREKSLDNTYFGQLKDSLSKNKSENTSWLSFNANKMSGKVTGMPLRDELSQDIKEQLIIEYYSR